MKELTVQLKRLGKKKVKKVPITLDSTPKNLKELISACVRSEVKRYNEKREGVQVLSFLTPTEIQEQGEKGKIGFGDEANTTLANENTAIENALLAFKDGLFLVFIDANEITDIDTQINLSSETELTFIRMTFLSGAYW